MSLLSFGNDGVNVYNAKWKVLFIDNLHKTYLCGSNQLIERDEQIFKMKYQLKEWRIIWIFKNYNDIHKKKTLKKRTSYENRIFNKKVDF